jgi:hypothetical protein
VTEKDVWEGFSAELARTKVSLCGMGKYLETLEAGPRKLVQDAGTDSAVPVTRLHQALTGCGFIKSCEVVRRHFVGSCACFRGASS